MSYDLHMIHPPLSAVITGDITQVDLPKHVKSGLKHAMHVLDGVEGISFTHFNAKDVVRHPIVQRIVEAYDEHDAETERKQQEARQEDGRKDS